MESPRILGLQVALENQQRIIFEMRDLCLQIQDELQPITDFKNEECRLLNRQGETNHGTQSRQT